MEYRIFPQKFLAGSESGAIKGSPGSEFRVAQMPDIDQGGHKAVVVQSAQLLANPVLPGRGEGPGVSRIHADAGRPEHSASGRFPTATNRQR
jgi:hypothetical protein